MNIFKDLIPHKTKKIDCKHPEWMDSLMVHLNKKELH